MQLDEKWIREHLPKELRDEDINVFSGLYLDGLKVMSYGERGDPDEVCFEAKDEEDLRWWQLERICHFVGKADKSRTWRWYRDHAENGRWLYVEHRHYDYDAIEDSRLAEFENFLRNLKYGFPAAEWEKRVQKYVGLMNKWYLIPHWDYDRERLCFIEISDSREHDDRADIVEEPRPGSVIRVID
jgi:hypothetical protein